MSAFVSVIIPTYNRADGLAGAVHTVRNQTFKNTEIIVVDDASTDDTQGTLARLQATVPSLRVITHKANKGVSAARNSGIKAARGDFIAFLDDDDIWKVDKLSLQLDVLRSSSLTNTLCLTYYVTKNRHGQEHIDEHFVQGPHKVSFFDPPRYSAEDVEHKLVTWNFWCCPGSTLCAHRSSIKKNGLFHEGIGRGEDTEYITRHLVRGGAVRVIPEYLMAYREPARRKVYAERGSHFHHYMLKTYYHGIARRWGQKVADQFFENLGTDYDVHVRWGLAERETLAPPPAPPASWQALNSFCSQLAGRVRKLIR